MRIVSVKKKAVNDMTINCLLGGLFISSTHRRRTFASDNHCLYAESDFNAGASHGSSRAEKEHLVQTEAGPCCVPGRWTDNRLAATVAN